MTNTPNILLVILDAARARNTSVHGYYRETTPFLSKYAQRATRYNQARAPGIHSIASHASIWTGLHVDEHRAIKHYDDVPIDESIWSELRKRGYRTGLFTGNAIVAHTSNLSEPFDTVISNEHINTNQKVYSDAFGPRDISENEGIAGNIKRCLNDDHPREALLNTLYHVYLKQRNVRMNTSLSSSDFVEAFLDWESETDGPWAACINLLDPHSPYEPSPEHDLWGGDELASIHQSLEDVQSKAFIGNRPWWQLEAFEHLYDGGIREADAYARRIIEGLKAAGVHDNTLVVVTSDHGEGFGEISRLTGAKMVEHNWGIHEVLTHVPLVVKYPEQSDSVSVSEVVSLTQFPNVVRDVISGKSTTDSFINEKPVVVSSHRLLKTDSEIFDESDESVEAYLGPWRAVYESHDEYVRKYATHDDESVVVDVYSSQDSILTNIEENETVAGVFTEIEHIGNINAYSDKAQDDVVTDRLKELGYLT